jgi:hypothetical protein
MLAMFAVVSHIGPGVPNPLAHLSSGDGDGHPVFERVAVGDDFVEVAWQKPTIPAVGTVFVAHGCQHAATDFFPQSARCAKCLGLPEVGPDR